MTLGQYYTHIRFIIVALSVILFTHNVYSPIVTEENLNQKTPDDDEIPPINIVKRLETYDLFRENCSTLIKYALHGQNCPDLDDWLPHLAREIGTNAHWVYVDVGANKGYGIAEMLMLLTDNVQRKTAANLFITLRATRDLKKEAGRGRQECGACCDCQSGIVPLEPKYRALSLRIFGFDLVPPTTKWLSHFFQGVPGVQIVNAGVSNKKGTVYVDKNILRSIESTSLDSKRSRFLSQDAVPVMTLKEGLGGKKAPRHIDFLSIDVEGYDSFVLAGARSFFLQGRVSVVQFEMHMKAGPTPEYTTIRGVVADLDTMGYECMLPLNAVEWRFRYKRVPKVTPLPQYVSVTGCQTPVLEIFKGWVNMLCYYRHNATLRSVFQKVRGLPRQPRGPCTASRR
eukprot:PhF_6_TR21217/c0_g1_i1/m.30644